MKKNDVKVGGVYAAKVSDKVVPVRIDEKNPHGGWRATNQTTGKKVRIKSAQRLRGPWPKKTMPTATERGNNKADDKGVAETVAAVEKGNLADGVTVPRSKRSAKTAKDAKKATKRDTGEPAATGGKRDAKPMSLLDAAAHLLSLGTGDPMRCKDIVDLAVARGLWTPGGGKTPANTLYASILREIKTKGDASRFIKAERGKFALASKA